MHRAMPNALTLYFGFFYWNFLFEKQYKMESEDFGFTYC
jgi:hypothetical protein